MERIFGRLENLPNYKDMMKLWCRQNGIKVSFVVNLSMAKAKTINKKIKNW